MPGFGYNKFGRRPFGRYAMVDSVLIGNLPESYIQADEEAGGSLVQFLEAVGETADNLREKIYGYDDLRNPLTVPVENDVVNINIIKVEDQGDDTALVFLEESQIGFIFAKIKPGFTLVDKAGNEFEVLEIFSAKLATEVEDPPLDMMRGETSGKSILVKLSAGSNQHILPRATGMDVTENPTSTDNGTNPSPYSFTLTKVPIVNNIVTVTWTVGGVGKTGYILPSGDLKGDLLLGSVLNKDTGVGTIYINGIANSNSISLAFTRQFDVGVETFIDEPPTSGYLAQTYNVVMTDEIPAGNVKIFWKVGGEDRQGLFDSKDIPYGDLLSTESIYYISSSIDREAGEMVIVSDGDIDAGTIRAIYDDSYVKPIHLLDLLAQDYGVVLDRTQPVDRQRSFVDGANELWSLKGSGHGYTVMGELHGQEVLASRLYRLGFSLITSVPPESLFVVGESELIVSEHNNGDPSPYILQAEDLPIPLRRIAIKWEESSVPKYGYFDYDGTPVGDLDPSSTVDRETGIITVVTAADVDEDTLTLHVGGWFYTELPPSRILYDDIIADVIPTDLYCWSDDYPTEDSTGLVITEVVQLGQELDYYIFDITVVADPAEKAFGTEGSVTQGADSWEIIDYTRLSDTEFILRIKGATLPDIMTDIDIEWRVIFFDATVTSVVDLGNIGSGTAHLYKVAITSTGSILATPYNWIFLDGLQQHSPIEALEILTPTTFIITIAAEDAPPVGDSTFYYKCIVSPSCDFCPASYIVLRVHSPVELDIQAQDRLERAIDVMIPEHVRRVYVYSDGVLPDL